MLKRRKFIIQRSLGMLATLPSMHLSGILDTPYFTTGIKIGEISSNTAIIWARLTQREVRVKDKGILPTILYWDDLVNEWHNKDYFSKKYNMGRPDRKVKVVMPEGYTIKTLDGAVSGIAGQIKIKYRPQGTLTWKTTPWEKVDTETDYTRQFTLQNLSENTKYEIVVLGKTENKGVKTLDGSFTAAPPKELSAPIHFMVTTCHEYGHQDIPENGGFKIFNEMKKLKPHFLVHTGDVLYHDRISKTLDLAPCN